MTATLWKAAQPSPLPDLFNGRVVLESIRQALGTSDGNLILDKPRRERKKGKPSAPEKTLSVCARSTASCLSRTWLGHGASEVENQHSFLLNKAGVLPGTGGF